MNQITAKFDNLNPCFKASNRNFLVTRKANFDNQTKQTFPSIKIHQFTSDTYIHKHKKII